MASIRAFSRRSFTPPSVEQHGGMTLHDVSVHNVFVSPVPLGRNNHGQSAPGPTINDAVTFLSDLFGSSIIHILDQYIGFSNSRRVGPQGERPK
jgi:hypothetical protein